MGVLTSRFLRARGSADAVKGLPASAAQRVRLLRGKALPQAMYGSEASPVCKQALKGLRASFANSLVNSSWTMRSPPLTFHAFGASL
eukprot:511144-Alexandrium_andersonii.AAC.1